MPFTLDFLSSSISTGLSTVDTTLTQAIGSVGSGTSISVPQMVDLQYQMSRYTITASLLSSMMKELSDTMKSVVQKIS